MTIRTTEIAAQFFVPMRPDLDGFTRCQCCGRADAKQALKDALFAPFARRAESASIVIYQLNSACYPTQDGRSLRCTVVAEVREADSGSLLNAWMDGSKAIAVQELQRNEEFSPVIRGTPEYNADLPDDASLEQEIGFVLEQLSHWPQLIGA